MLNPEQSRAVDKMQDFIADMQDGITDGSDKFFLLSGPAGTGKTYCIRELIPRFRGRLVFTAPTNKATKVLRASVTSDDYKPECRTIYSLLGLKLEANGEVKELREPEDPLDLTKFAAVVVDEASMINETVWGYIRQTAENQGIPFIFMGDAAQLPPVKELHSPVWKEVTQKAELTTVMRHDNQILTLATYLRGFVGHPAPNLTLKSNNDGVEGVWRRSAADVEELVFSQARAGLFSEPSTSKVIAWRNSTVNTWNAFIRCDIFDNAAQVRWLTGDRIIVTEPAKSFLPGEEGRTLATVDDEGIVTAASAVDHPLHPQFKTWRINVTLDDNRPILLWALHEDSAITFANHVAGLSAAARAMPRLWKDFWAFKEQFHAARYGYAITAHRSQGSTYENAFVCFSDILLNRNKPEAVRCLYTAVTRPKKQLVLF